MFPECLECRGIRAMCEIHPCPLLSEVRRRLPQKTATQIEVLSGPSPPSLFVGRYGYPKVTVGPQASALPDEDEILMSPADPAEMFGQPLEVVAGRHANLVRGRSEISVKDAAVPNKVLQTAQEIAMAVRDVDVEMEFSSPIHLGRTPTFDSLSRPLGPSGDVKRADITSNPVIPRKVGSVVDETDLLATEAIEELNASNIGEAHLTRLLSSGLLGHEKRRRMVPTRWAITATDDTLGKQIWGKVRDNPTIDKVEVYHAEYLDNHFHIILTPGYWAFHMLEVWMRGSLWSEKNRILEDWEEEKPRTAYASQITGAYYSARLAVLEQLNDRRRSAAALVWRDIGAGYWAPIGVWLIRETMREAMKQKPIIFDSLDEAIHYVAPIISSGEKLKEAWFVNRSRQTRVEEWSF